MKPYDRATRTYDQEFFLVHPSNNAFSYTIWKPSVVSGIMSLHMNIFWPKLILFVCSTQMFMIISFLPNGDLKHTYVFPLMINVFLRISHK
jgi:hypothetical protein